MVVPLCQANETIVCHLISSRMNAVCLCWWGCWMLNVDRHKYSLPGSQLACTRYIITLIPRTGREYTNVVSCTKRFRNQRNCIIYTSSTCWTNCLHGGYDPLQDSSARVPGFNSYEYQSLALSLFSYLLHNNFKCMFDSISTNFLVVHVCLTAFLVVVHVHMSCYKTKYR